MVIMADFFEHGEFENKSVDDTIHVSQHAKNYPLMHVALWHSIQQFSGNPLANTFKNEPIACLDMDSDARKIVFGVSDKKIHTSLLSYRD